MVRRTGLSRGAGLDADGCTEVPAVGSPPESSLDDQLAGIARLDIPALRASWARHFGHPPPKGLGRHLLELATAYNVQAEKHGGLKPVVRRTLLRAVRPQSDSADAAPQRKRQSATAPGTRLVREWHGRSHTVEIMEGGFQYAGRQYRSLSAVARIITGARWSGPRFFGL
jgi:hypothetical protein